ncbi:MAG TPA: hypothetical protein VEV84_05410 [Pyrinomonadaceae bacterium]|nr:hypothetical protein [Pyrinomonadaceae bacterium]
MIRRVAFGKAVIAGVAGAGAWEGAVRLLIWFGLPMFDIVRILSMMIVGRGAPIWEWWPVGIAMHAMIGAIWAIFYAYFFWSFFDLNPTVQGLLFSLLPALLAGLIMIPQMDFMLNGQHPPLRVFAIGIGVLGPVSVVIGHLIYGLVMGSIYVRPVGYRVGRHKIQYG